MPAALVDLHADIRRRPQLLKWFDGNKRIVAGRNHQDRHGDLPNERQRRGPAVIVECIDEPAARRREQVVELAQRQFLGKSGSGGSG